LKDKIRNLILLQDCDNNIKEVDRRKKQAPLKIRELDEVFAGKEATFEEEGKRLEALKKQRRTLEQVVQDLESKLAKSRIKLSNIKSNKEYTAALKEIEELEKEKGKYEEDVLQMMEEIESMEKKYLDDKNSLVESKRQFERAKEKIQNEIKELDNRSVVLEKQREELSRAVDQDLLKRYLFLKERKKGIAIGPVIGGVCQSCHMGMPPQQFIELRRGDSLLTCPSCARLLYWGEDEYFSKKALERAGSSG
jgi:predicted  nucleic acid-binding Zn-ribbon protein